MLHWTHIGWLNLRLEADHGSHIEARQFSSRLAEADLPTIGKDAAALMPLPSFRTLTAASRL